MATDAQPMDSSLIQPRHMEQSYIKELNSLRHSMSVRPFSNSHDQLSVPSFTRRRANTIASSHSSAPLPDPSLPPRSSTHRKAEQPSDFQYLILRNPPSDWNKPRRARNQSLQKRRS